MEHKAMHLGHVYGINKVQDRDQWQTCERGNESLGSVSTWNFFTEELLASEGGVCCVELFIYFVCLFFSKARNNAHYLVSQTYCKTS